MLGHIHHLYQDSVAFLTPDNTSFTSGSFFLVNTSGRRLSSIPEDMEFKQKLQRYAYGYLMLGVCVLGVVGNALTFAVLSRQSMRYSNTATYLRSLAVVDACVLLLALFRYRSYYVLLSETQVIHVLMTFDRYVQVYVVPFFWICLGVSSYVTLSLSLERYLVIRWPFTLKKTCWVNVVRAGTAVAMATICLLTLLILLCYRMKQTTFRGLRVTAVMVTDSYLHARAYLHTFSHYLMPLLWYMGPWAIVAIVNVLLFLQVQKSSRIRVGVPNSLNPNRNLSLLIILIVGVYMVCNLPRCVLALYCLVNHCSTNNDGDDVSSKAYLFFIVLADILNILNSCLNIVVYCLTGTKFRREVKELLLCRSSCGNAVSHLMPQSVHISLREVAATPVDCRKSFNMSFKELQLPSTNVLHSCSALHGDLQPPTFCSPCPQSFLTETTTPFPASSSSSSSSSASSSKVFRYDPSDVSSRQLPKPLLLLLQPPMSTKPDPHGSPPRRGRGKRTLLIK